MGTINSLVTQANSWRKDQVFAVLDSLDHGHKPDTTSLEQNASRPMALGFSSEDLLFFRNMYAQKSATYKADADRAMAFVARTNVKISRDGGHATKEQVADRKEATADASWNAHRARVCAQFVEIVNEILSVLHAPAPAPTVTVMQAAPAPIKPIVLKVKHHVKKVAVCRGEITLKSFADLSEYKENTAMILG